MKTSLALIAVLIPLAFSTIGAVSPAGPVSNFRQPQVPAPAGYTPNTVTLSGAVGESWMERDAQLYTSHTNQLYASMWIKPSAAGVDTIDAIYGHSDDGWRMYLSSGNQFIFQCEDASNTELIQLRSTATIVRDGNTWTHIFVRCDRTVDNQGEVYVNGSLSTSITTFLSTGEDADPIDMDAADVVIGAIDTTGGSAFGGCIADLWIGVGHTYANITVSDFISGGHAVDLGATGTGPDGTQPVIFLRSAGDGFNVNSGTGGNFVKKGTVTTYTACSNAP